VSESGGQNARPTKNYAMKIFFAAIEMTNYAQTGGLGDVVSALSSELVKLGHEVTCCIPFYRCARLRVEADAAARQAPEAKSIGLTLSVPLGNRTVTGDILELRQRDGVRVLFVRRDEFFDRSELYYTGVRDYEDNAERFLFFSKAVAELIGYTRFRAEVVHCHDWQAAFAAVEIRRRKTPQAGTPVPPSGETTTGGTPVPPDFSDVKTVLTIHNIAYQGMFSNRDFPLTNLPGEFFTPETLEFYGQMNLLKGGIVFADAITTVSQTYAKEILTPENGFGLDPVLETRADDLHGIVNGVDYTRWNPENDRHLRQRYHIDDMSGKRACREELLGKLGLGENPPLTAPGRGDRQMVAAFVSRLTEQKGVDVLIGAIEELVESGLMLAILGRGERKYEELLEGVAVEFPGRVAVRIAHDDELAHQIQAGADILLVPSHFEPCGLTQLYALKYGTIPVVRATGGLDDTVVAYDARTGEGTGFKFAPYTSAALVEAAQQAILLHKQPKKWQRLVHNAMACDFSWQASVKEYEKLYAALEGH
jgi:starch synthase